MEPKKTTCSNCQSQLSPDGHYCPACGQKAVDRISIKYLFESLSNALFSFDSRIVKTIPSLLLQPGLVPREFVNGKRNRFIAPISLYVMLSFLFFLLFTQLLVNQWDSQFQSTVEEWIPKFSSNFEQGIIENSSVVLDSSEVDFLVDSSMVNISAIDSLIQEGYSNEEIMEYQGFVVEHPFLTMIYETFINFLRNKGAGSVVVLFSQLSLIIVFFIVCLSFLLALLHYRHAVHLPEHVVHVLYLFNFYLLLAIVCLLLYALFPISYWWYVFLVIAPLYFYISLKTFYQQSYAKAGLKHAITSVVIWIVLVPISILLMFFLTMLQYGQ